MHAKSPLQYVLRHPGRFLFDVLRGFRDNQGLLLAGAVAYYTLLSIIPVFALVLIVLSQFVEQAQLHDTVTTILALVAPIRSDVIATHLEAFLSHWKVIGTMGLLLLLFFSSLAFTVLENAMSMIFFHRRFRHSRHYLVSVILPYAYISLLAAGFLVVSLMSGWLDQHSADTPSLLGFDIDMSSTTATTLYLLGVFGEVLLLTSVYLVMPVGQLAWTHALVGGIAATLLWELTRHALVWYFTTLSFVSIIYGSLATTIIILLSFEFAAIILLLGAQVIAEYERIDHGGVTPRPGQAGSTGPEIN
ncbi:MAG: YihY/virulence factor BrkB family protein [Gammaproteobacteria bacterium]|nr:YihY/virulence factor BrkB family protein [Gammaproteobacteria bacterium]